MTKPVNSWAVCAFDNVTMFTKRMTKSKLLMWKESRTAFLLLKMFVSSQSKNLYKRQCLPKNNFIICIKLHLQSIHDDAMDNIHHVYYNQRHSF